MPPSRRPEVPQVASSAPYAPATEDEQLDADPAPRQACCGLPKRLRQISPMSPMRPRAAKLIKPSLQMHDWLGDLSVLARLELRQEESAPVLAQLRNNSSSGKNSGWPLCSDDSYSLVSTDAY